jgi:N,N-dimethylformamidase
MAGVAALFRPDELVGYVDRWSVAPGDLLSVMVSCLHPEYQAELVSIVHGDENPAGPGRKITRVPSDLDGRHAGVFKRLVRGSYVVANDTPQLFSPAALTVETWICATAIALMRPQGIVARWQEAGSIGWSLQLDGANVTFVLGRGEGDTKEVRSRLCIREGEWYYVAAGYGDGHAFVCVRPARLQRDGFDEAECRGPGPADAAVTIGARAVRRTGAWPEPLDLFNGRIESPRLVAGALSDGDEGIASGPLLAHWDFAEDQSGAVIIDRSSYGTHARAVNMPMRAVTGHAWDGAPACFVDAPALWNAIHFHDDDLEDCGWEPDFSWRVPSGLHSGVYGVRVWVGEVEDVIPFFLRPARGRATAETLILAPTLSYLAYGNEHGVLTGGLDEFSERFVGVSLATLVARASAADHFIKRERLLSVYDPHSDGSENCYSSMLRPVLTMRPFARMPLIEAPHQFPADLHLVDWLDHEGFVVDVATDHDLHFEGAELLQRYRVVLTGSHPEYWSGAMLDALASYLDAGGRVMYLGGNGLYWVTSPDARRPHVIEVRRGVSGTRCWESKPGEMYHSTTAEQGGLWRHRRHAPQWYVGVGFTSQGGGPSRPYVRTPASRDERVAFIFDGVDETPIGVDGLVLGAAAGYEIDRAEVSLGTPPHTLVMATASGFTDHYQGAVEDVLMSDSLQSGSTCPLVRADMTFFETAAGGAAFSAGSVTWCGSLSAGDYDNHVARITGNVLRRFLDPQPFDFPELDDDSVV